MIHKQVVNILTGIERIVMINDRLFYLKIVGNIMLYLCDDRSCINRLAEKKISLPRGSIKT